MKWSIWAVILVGISMSWFSESQAQEARLTVTTQKTGDEQQLAAAPGVYLAPELRLVQSLEVTFLGMTDDGDAVYAAPPDAGARLLASDLVSRVEKGAAEHEPVQLIIGYTKENKEAVQQQLKEAGLKVVEDREKATFFRVEVADRQQGLNAQSVQVLAQSQATSVTPDYRVRIPQRPAARRGARATSNVLAVPNDYDPQILWGLENIQAPTAWNGISQSSIIVAVIDTGVDYNHEDLADSMWTGDDGQHGYDFANDDDDPMDDQGHGTHCAGTIGAVGNNGLGLVGVNWRANIMALKFLNQNGSGSTSDAIDCIDYAVDHGAKVLSNSWGGGGFSPELKEAIDRVEQAGALFIAAAGNGGFDGKGDDNDATAHYPSSYVNDCIIAVAAIGPNNELTIFSNFGQDSVDLAAPGADIASTVPGNDYTKFSGTSMATPHVSGACAMAWAHVDHQSKDWAQIKKLVQDHVQSEPGLQGKCQWGGRLNVAMLGAGGSPPPPPPQLAAFARSASFSWQDGKTASGATTLLSIELNLSQPMDVHMIASSSAMSEGGKPLRFTTGLSGQDAAWDSSFRYVDIAEADNWVNFSTHHAERLEAGSHTIQWHIWPDTEESALLDSGALLIQAYPVSGSSTGAAARGPRNLRRAVSAAPGRRARDVGDLKRQPGKQEDYPRIRARVEEQPVQPRAPRANRR